MSATTTTHLASLITAPGAPLSVLPVPTPVPGPRQVLVRVSAVGLNPIDNFNLAYGMFVDPALYHTATPLAGPGACVGSDVGGVVEAVGSDVTEAAYPGLRPGTRVAAMASSFFARGKPEFGAFQEKVLVGAEFVTVLPSTSSTTSTTANNNNNNISLPQAATLGMAISTVFAGLHTIGMPVRELAANPVNNDSSTTNKKTRQAALVWGATSSVGTMAVQVLRALGFEVWATASPRHHDYVRSVLGASRVFDYAAGDVERQILDAAAAAAYTPDGEDEKGAEKKREQQLVFNYAYVAAGDLRVAMRVVGQLRGETEEEEEDGKGGQQGKKKTTGMVASAPMLPADDDDENNPWRVDGVEARFAVHEQDTEWRRFVYGEWLAAKLASGEVVPSPPVRVVGGQKGGLEGVAEGLEVLAKGVSCEKLVVEI